LGIDEEQDGAKRHGMGCRSWWDSHKKSGKAAQTNKGLHQIRAMSLSANQNPLGLSQSIGWIASSLRSSQ
jgi:hypothetical protein